jgi:hypothetical protein
VVLSDQRRGGELAPHRLELLVTRSVGCVVDGAGASGDQLAPVVLVLAGQMLRRTLRSTRR